MSRKTVYTKDAPTAPLNASQAVVCNGMVHCSGNLALEETMQIVAGGIQAETRRVLENLSTILKAAGSSLASVIKLNIFIISMDDFKAMNDVYNEFFSKFDQKPCRTCVPVPQLAFGAKVEMDCVAILDPPSAKL
ncbi:2-iminobutanoate/2-iminopropanoate deaminase [Alternaria panax]|uniref:2-iminobutanoate/2-iminopropanoate deaminase n=1 Tax=Alternaria panax TaxID=48097 RepID=A0AAD4IAM9_9PLEO|nr:2-iminobutanoate/2-iminopropanoate deaminase [Alternaria panax]